MTLDEIKTWALDHGFKAVGPSVMTAPYRDAEVTLTFLRVAVQVKIANTHGEFKIGTFRPGNGIIRVTKDDVLEGMGLSASFLSAYVRDTGPKPVWMSDAYFYGVTKQPVLEIAPEAPEPPRC